MHRHVLGSVIVACLVFIGCTGRHTSVVPEADVATEDRRRPIHGCATWRSTLRSSLKPTVRVADRHVFEFREARVELDGESALYTVRESVVDDDDDHSSTRVLRSCCHPEEDPVLYWRITRDETGLEVILTLSTDGPLPRVHLTLNVYSGTPTGLEQPRLMHVRTEPEGQGVIQSTVGLGHELITDALYDTDSDMLLFLDGEVGYGRATIGIHRQAEPHEEYFTRPPPRNDSPREIEQREEASTLVMERVLYGIGVSVPRSDETSVTALRITARENALGERLGMDAAAAAPELPAVAPAGWSDAMLPGPQKAAMIVRNARWMAANLAPFGADRVWMSTLDREARAVVGEFGLGAAEGEADPTAGAPWRMKARRTASIYQRVAERDRHYNWQHAKELLATTLEDYVGHGLCRIGAPGPVRIGEPLSIDHARMWLSLLALSGQAVILGDALDELPAERVAMLRRILPPAPIRAVDLFDHELPEQWHLHLDRSFGPQHIRGLFNWSPVRRSMTVDLPPSRPWDPDRAVYENGKAWAIYDLWERRLLAITDEPFALSLRPTSCRVVSVHRIKPDAPTLLGSHRHLLMGATTDLKIDIPTIDPADVRYDHSRRTMSGRSRVVAHDPYELVLLLPESAEGYEIEAVEASGADALVRAHGVIRIVTLESTRTTELPWTIQFRRAAQVLHPLSPPSEITTEQNTRGVLVSWVGIDDRTARYRVYRDNQRVAELPADEHAFQDSDIDYDRAYRYTVTTVDAAGRASRPGPAVNHRTPIPTSTNLTTLSPLFVEQEHLALGQDVSAAGRPLSMGGRSYDHGLGMHANARVAFFIGDGYDLFTGEVGIDDGAEGKGSAVFKIVADGQTLFTSEVLRGGDQPEAFSVSVAGKRQLELIVTDAGDGADFDHTNWGHPHLQVTRARAPAAPPRSEGTD